MSNPNPYPNLDQNLILTLTLKPSLNPQKVFKGLSEWGPAKMSSLSKKCPHFHGVKLKWLKIVLTLFAPGPPHWVRLSFYLNSLWVCVFVDVIYVYPTFGNVREGVGKK